MNTSQLVRYIHQHYHKAYRRIDGMIVAELVYTWQGTTYTKWETVIPTYHEVRKWLGY